MSRHDLINVTCILQSYLEEFPRLYQTLPPNTTAITARLTGASERLESATSSDEKAKVAIWASEMAGALDEMKNCALALKRAAGEATDECTQKLNSLRTLVVRVGSECGIQVLPKAPTEPDSMGKDDNCNRQDWDCVSNVRR